MRRVIIESPYAGDTTQNINYLKDALRDSLSRGEAPFASHAIYPLVLDDTIFNERSMGIVAGFSWWDAAEAIIFYNDYGMSQGMRVAYEKALREKRPLEVRYLYPREARA